MGSAPFLLLGTGGERPRTCLPGSAPPWSCPCLTSFVVCSPIRCWEPPKRATSCRPRRKPWDPGHGKVLSAPEGRRPAQRQGSPPVSHTYTNILIHALFSTRVRRPWLNPPSQFSRGSHCLFKETTGCARPAMCLRMKENLMPPLRGWAIAGCDPNPTACLRRGLEDVARCAGFRAM